MTVTPARAAGLVLLRHSTPDSTALGSTGTLEVLLGRRHRHSRFMPNVYVFPGGRIDDADDQPSGFTEDMPSPPGPSPLGAPELTVFARGALRETFEETGLLVGQTVGRTDAPPATASPQTSGVWAAYSQASLVPAFAVLSLLARAVTPVDYPIRFDTYFFAADGATTHGKLAGDGELGDVGWVPVGSAPALPMAEVTRLILKEALIRQDDPAETRDLPTFSV